jgi:hypothetical protein
LLSGGYASQAQVAPMILRPRSFIGSNGIQVDIFANGNSESFNQLYDDHVQVYGDGKDAQEAFLACFTWEPVDRQHIQGAYINIAAEYVKKGVMTKAEYNDLFSKWHTHVVIYDEP